MIVTPAVISALQTTFKKNYQDGFAGMKAASAYQQVATVINSSSKSETYGWLGMFPKMREWIGDRVYQNMESHGYSIVNKDFESTVPVPRNDIEDDNLGIYRPLMQSMGEEAGLMPDDLTFGLLAKGDTETCYDGQYFFDTDHPSFDKDGNPITVSNIDASGAVGAPWWYLLDTSKALKPMIFQDRKSAEFIAHTDPTRSDHVFNKKEFVYGVDCRCNVGFGFWQMAYASNAALNSDNLDEAIKSMRSLKDTNGRPLGIKPTLLVVGPDLRSAANKTVKVMLGEGGASNSNYKAVEVLDTDWVA